MPQNEHEHEYEYEYDEASALTDPAVDLVARTVGVMALTADAGWGRMRACDALS